MEARSFFENSPMAEVTVSATPDEWREILVDLNELRLMYDQEGIDLETSTVNLRHFLAKVKVFI